MLKVPTSAAKGLAKKDPSKAVTETKKITTPAKKTEVKTEVKKAPVVVEKKAEVKKVLVPEKKKVSDNPNQKIKTVKDADVKEPLLKVDAPKTISLKDLLTNAAKSMTTTPTFSWLGKK